MLNPIFRFVMGAVLSVALFTLTVTGSYAMTFRGSAPDFQFTVADKQYTLSDLRGRVVVLDFWASWCPPCRRSLPEISRLNDRFDDVVFLGINDEDQATIRQTQRQLNLSFPTTLDSDRSIAGLYGVSSIPTTVVIDKYGRVVEAIVGFRADGSLERAIERARRIQ